MLWINTGILHPFLVKDQFQVLEGKIHNALNFFFLRLKLQIHSSSTLHTTCLYATRWAVYKNLCAFYTVFCHESFIMFWKCFTYH